MSSCTSAVCGCGERFAAASIDALNAALAKHYKTCDGKRGRPRK